MVSLSQVLCAWDIFEHVLVQKITVKFPFSQRLPDHGPSVLHMLPTNCSLCVLCNEYIAELKVGSATGAASKQSVWSVTSHEHPLCAALYNSHFHQVKTLVRSAKGWGEGECCMRLDRSRVESCECKNCILYVPPTIFT